MWFSHDGCSFEIHDTAEAAKRVAETALDDERDVATDGWSEEAMRICWGRVVAHAEITSERARTEEDYCDPDIESIVEIEMVGSDEYRCNICGGIRSASFVP